MTDYGEYRQPSRGSSLIRPAADAIRRSLTRNSSYSHNTPSVSATTRSWVYSTQQNPPGPPPPPPPLPFSPPPRVQHPRPLPIPRVQHRRAALHAVNPSEPLDHEKYEERMGAITNTPDAAYLAYRKAKSSRVRNPGTSMPSSADNSTNKKRTTIKGLVKSIRKIPRVMFGYGAGEGTKLRRRGTLGTDGEGTSGITGTTRTDNTLPQYVSNPSTPVAAPIPSHLHHYTHQPTGIPMMVPVSGSPPPEVVRLDDVRRHCPDFRIIPPSVNIARSETAHFFPGSNTTTARSSQFVDNQTDSTSSAPNTAERTTVMLYDHDYHTHTPTPPLSRQISCNGPPGRLSYVGSEQIVRPTSFHGGSQAPPPIDIPTSTMRMGTPSSHLSYVSQVATVPSTLPLHVKRSSSQQRPQSSNQSQQHRHQLTSPEHQPSSTPPIIESSEPIQSPISAHPQPTTDYLKMALSPPHSLQHHTTALTTSTANPCSSSGLTSFSYDPSFSSPSSLVERFFKTLYRMPWVAYDRITVDYLPGKVGRVHGHALSREKSSRGVRDGKRRRGGDRRRRGTEDTREGERRRERRRKKERRSRAGRAGRGHGDEKPVSWYTAAFSRSRTSAELDLLSSDLGSRSSPTTTTSLGATIGLGLENLPVDAASPGLAAAANVGKSAERPHERKENVGDKQERTSGNHRHHHRGRQKQGIGSIGSPDDPGVDNQEEQYKDNEDQGFNQSPSPLIPTVYPFHYPPYPYTYPYTAFTMPPPHGGPPPVVSAHVPQFQSQSQSQTQAQRHHLSPTSEQPPNDRSRTSKNPRGPRSSANQTSRGPQLPQLPLTYGPGISHPGYAAAAHAYQPMIAPSTSAMMAPQVYLLHSTSHGQLQAQPQPQPQHLSSSGRMENGSGTASGGGGGLPVGSTGDSSLRQILEQ